MKLEMEIPDHTCSALRLSGEGLADYLRVRAAVKGYEQGELSQERAAELAGQSRQTFLDTLSRLRVSPFQGGEEDLAAEVREASPAYDVSMPHRLKIDYGDDVLLSSGLTRDAFDREARFLLASKLYELGRISSGQAATLSGKERVEFLLDLPKVGVSVSNLCAEDAASELGFVRNG